MKILQNKSSKIKEKRPNLENSINFKEKLTPRKNISIDDKIKKKIRLNIINQKIIFIFKKLKKEAFLLT